MELNNHYIKLFDLNNNYTLAELNQAYNKILLKYHKDNNNDQNLYNNINEYYNKLLQKLNNNSNNFSSSFSDNNINNNYPISLNQTSKTYNQNILNNQSIGLNNENYTYIEPITINLLITYEESYNGSTKPLNITRIINNYNMISKENETIYIDIPEGIDNNEIIVIENKGNCYNNNYGNIKINIALNKHELFIRNGLDIVYEKDITLKESLLGFSFEIIFLNNKKYIINNEYIISNYSKIIKDLGFKRSNFKGNLIINFNIKFPKYLSIEQKEKLKEIL